MGDRRKEPNIMGEWLCPGPPRKGCGKWKPEHAFHHNKRTSNGLSTYCKECHNTKQKTIWSPKAQMENLLVREETAQDKLHDVLGVIKFMMEFELGDEDTYVVAGRRYRIIFEDWDGPPVDVPSDPETPQASDITDEELENLKWRPGSD